jgi:hypothetical protein
VKLLVDRGARSTSRTRSTRARRSAAGSIAISRQSPPTCSPSART